MTLSITQEVLPIDTPNHNQRTYCRTAVEQMVIDFNAKKAADEFVFGEFKQPAREEINLDRVSHSIDKLYIDGDHLKAKIEVLPTPMGNVLEELYESIPDNIKLLFRGYGKIDEDDGIVTECHLISVDVGCGYPSTKEHHNDAFDDVIISMRTDGLL